jgi:hypothetical protein
MASYPPPQPNPPSTIYNPAEWQYPADGTSFTLAELEALFVLKAGDVCTGLINFAGGIAVEGSALLSCPLTLTYSASTLTLTSSSISTPVWSIDSAGTFSGSVTNAINSTTTQTITAVQNTNNATTYVPFFLSNTTAFQGIKINLSFYYNPSTNLLNTNISGNSNYATQASNVGMSNITSASVYSVPLTLLTTGYQPLTTKSTLTFNASTNTLSVTNLQGIASSATQAVVTNNATNSSFYLPFISSSTTGTYSLNVNNSISLNPSTGTLISSGTLQGTTVNVQAVSGARSLSVQNGGMLMLWNTGSTQYTQIQNLADTQTPAYIALQIDPAYGLYFNMNQQGLVSVATTAGQKNRLEIGCNQGAQNEIDFCASSTNGAGGFNFYKKSNTVALSLIGRIPNTQPPPTDSTQNLATTAFVQSVLSATVPVRGTYYQNVGINITQVYLNNLIQISNLGTSNFYGNVNNFITVRYTYTTFSASQLFFSSTGTLMLYPQRISGTVPAEGGGGNAFFGGGNGTTIITSYNINNNINGSTAFNVIDPLYCAYGRQYWNSAPTQGLNSGYVGQPNTLFMNGTAFTSGGITSTYFGFNLINPGYPSLTTFNYCVELELVQNPYPSVTVTLLPSFSIV